MQVCAKWVNLSMLTCTYKLTNFTKMTMSFSEIYQSFIRLRDYPNILVYPLPPSSTIFLLLLSSPSCSFFFFFFFFLRRKKYCFFYILAVSSKFVHNYYQTYYFFNMWGGVKPILLHYDWWWCSPTSAVYLQHRALVFQSCLYFTKLFRKLG